MLQRFTLFCLALILAGTASAQLAPNAPKDKGQGFTSAQSDAVQRAISPYITQGRATYPNAKARFLSGLPNGQTLYVWTTLHQPPNLSESVFIRVVSIEEGEITGRLASDIRLLQGYSAGQIVRIPEASVLDWLISHPDGTEEGNVVGKFLDNYHPPGNQP
jgi:hypothetical protein